MALSTYPFTDSSEDFSLAFLIISVITGVKISAIIANITITAKSSIRVNPLTLLVNVPPPYEQMFLNCFSYLSTPYLTFI